MWGACGECVCPVSRLHQSKHLPAAVPLPGLSLWEQLFVHGTGSLRLPLLQTRSRHWFPITRLRMWWVFVFFYPYCVKILLDSHRLRLCHIVYCVRRRYRVKPYREFEKLHVCIFTGVVCLGGMLYSHCVSSCGRSCRALSSTETCNPDECAEGCGCPVGSYYDDVRQRCVQL